MRVTGGEARGIPLKTGSGLRPATDRTRQALFSSLGEAVGGARFADLFAGSGAYGLEALSRGAAGGVFIEKDGRLCASIRENLEAVMKSMGMGRSPCVVENRDALAWRPRSQSSFDLVFADPPYALLETDAPAIFEAAHRAARPGGLLALEAPGEFSTEPEGWRLLRVIGKPGKGQPTMQLWQKAEEQGSEPVLP